MMTLSSTGAVLSALRGAREISMLAYTLRPGAVEDALVDAASRGAHVRVRLEGRPYADAQGELLADNRDAIAALSRAGADARLVDTDPRAPAPLHAKAIVADATVFLDDRNWPGDDAQTIVRDTFAHDARAVNDAIAGNGDDPSPFFAIRKRDALASEARLVAHATRGDDPIVETESFGGGNRVYSALDRAARAGLAPRLLVSARDLRNNARERAALAKLARDGARVRVCDADEKFALAGTRGWLGSANASAAFDEPDQLDWGVRTDAPDIVQHLRRTFEARWSAAQPLG